MLDGCTLFDPCMCAAGSNVRSETQMLMQQNSKQHVAAVLWTSGENVWRLQMRPVCAQTRELSPKFVADAVRCASGLCLFTKTIVKVRLVYTVVRKPLMPSMMNQ